MMAATAVVVATAAAESSLRVGTWRKFFTVRSFTVEVDSGDDSDGGEKGAGDAGVVVDGIEIGIIGEASRARLFECVSAI